MSRAEASGFDERVPLTTYDLDESSERPQYEIILDKLLQANNDTILSIDPGGTTGLAWTEDHAIHTADLSDKLFCDWMRLLVMKHYSVGLDYDAVVRTIGVPDLPRRPGVIVVESWRLYRANVRAFINSDMPTSQLIGRVREVADLLSIPVVEQAASQMLSVPWAKLGGNDHQHDAGKHLVRYLLDRSADGGRISM